MTPNRFFPSFFLRSSSICWVTTFEFLSTSVKNCWCSIWFNQSLGFWFSFNHMILHSNKWCVSFMDFIILGPVSSTETDKRDPSQQYVEGNYNSGADDLTANTCTVCRLIYISMQVRKCSLKRKYTAKWFLLMLLPVVHRKKRTSQWCRAVFPQKWVTQPLLKPEACSHHYTLKYKSLTATKCKTHVMKCQLHSQ